VIETAAKVFDQYRDPEPYARAERFCRYIGRYSNGVLQQHGPASYRFSHRTFQEFLAARRLVDDRDWQGDERDRLLRLRARAGSAQWREVLLLAVSQLLLYGKHSSVAQLVRLLLNEYRKGSKAWAHNTVIAGEILTQATRTQLEAVGAGQLWTDAAAALRRVVIPAAERSWLDKLSQRKPKRSPLDSADRIRAGLHLGVLGDPRRGVATLEPDWCDVPAGPFLLGSDDTSSEAEFDGKPQRTVELPGFRISRYPVTNAQ
jgi:hypothetical protein